MDYKKDLREQTNPIFNTAKSMLLMYRVRPRLYLVGGTSRTAYDD